ncbi:MAG: class I SAM-dependent methyltransferase, partial [Nitrospinota bacterium]
MPLQISLSAYQKSMHLDEGMIGPKLESCPFCTSREFRGEGITIHREPDVALVKCLNCGAAFAERMPTQKALDKYYSGYYKRYQGAKSDKAVTHSDTREFAKRIAAIYFKHADVKDAKGANVLDFGGGDGSLGVEVNAAVKKLLDSPRNSGNAQKQIGGAYLIDVADIEPVEGCEKLPSLDECGDLRFDLIIASAILEHLADPRECLQKLASLASPESNKSFIYFRTPYAAPLIKLAAAMGVALDFTYPGHVSDLGVDFYMNIQKCLPGFGAKAVYCGTTQAETTFAQSAPRTLASHFFKFPFRALTTL